MKQLIENLRNKPQGYRNRFILIATISATGILLICWAIIGMPPRETDGGDVLIEINQDINSSKDTFPELFPKE